MIEMTSKMTMTTATAKPTGPPAAAIAYLPTAAAPFPAVAATLIDVAAILPALAALAVVAAAFEPFAARTPFFTPAFINTSSIRPPPIAMVKSFTIAILARLGFGAADTSG